MKTLKHIATLLAFFAAGRLFGLVGCLVLLAIFYFAGYFKSDKETTEEQS